MEKVTIYITNYNYGNFIEKAIDSALSQTYKNIEVLVFDDGSTDDSLQILEKFENDANLKVFKGKNIGLNATIIKAFEEASGDFVIRLDADDWLDHQMVERLVEEIKKDDNCALVFPDYYEVDEDERVLHQVRRHDFKSGVTLLDQPAHGACTLVRKSHYMNVGGHNSKYKCQDGVDIWLSITNKYNVSNVNLPLFYYRKHSTSLSSNTLRILKTRFEIYKDHAYERGFESEKIQAIIPVREQKFGDKNYALMEVGGKPLIEWTIAKAVNSKEIDEIIVLTESDEILEYLESRSSEDGVTGYKRSKLLARHGSDIAHSILDFDSSYNKELVDIFVVLTCDTPFSLINYVDTAIYSMYLYGTKSVDSVLQDNSLFYYHSGESLFLWQNTSIRHENEDKFVRKGGISVIKRDALIEGKSLITDRMGHVIIDKMSSYTIETIDDLTICNMIANSFEVTE